MAIDPRTPVSDPNARLMELIRDLQRRVEMLERQVARLQGRSR